MRTLLIFLCLSSSAFAFDWQSDVQSGNFTSESHQGDVNNIRKDGEKVTYIQNGNWIAYQDFDFGTGVEYMWIEGASSGSDGTVELRLGSSSGTLIGSVAITDTGGWNAYKPFGLKIPQPVTGVQNLYLKCVGGGGYLFNLGKFRFQRLAPDYKRPGAIVDWKKPVLSSVGMNSAGSFSLESHPLDDSTIRLENGKISYIMPNSWVCYEDVDLGAGANFFSILGASQNGGGTVEVRIGSPTGTLIGSVAIANTGEWGNYRPFATDLVQSVAGVQDLYFKFVGSGWGLFDLASFRFQNLAPSQKSPGRLVSANLFDQESHPGVEPVVSDSNGISSLTNGSWVSYANFDFGTETDLITIEAATPNKGGAVEVRVGSASGPLIATLDVTYTGSWTHYRPYTAALSQKYSGIHNLFFKGGNCHIEGITIADPAEHGLYVENWNGVQHMPQNSTCWIKNISWRVNNDTGGTGGLMEDCFFRHQDDGIYVGGSDVRRCVFWSDVNGVPFHCPFMARDGVPEAITMFPREVVIEDCDIIYARGMFGFSGSKEFGIISNHFLTDNGAYSEGTLNTAQHVVFRNIRVTDPRPLRNLFGLHIKNLLEYVLGGDPRKSSTEFLPKGTIEGTDLVLTYKRSDASETDTIQAGQWSTDLQTWSDADVTVELVSKNATAPNDMKVRIPLSKAIDGKIFGRLHVSKP